MMADIKDNGLKNTIFNTTVENIAKTFGKYRNLALDIDVTNSFLGVDPSEQINLREIFPKFMNPMISQAVDKYISINGFKIEMQKNFRYGDKEIPIEYKSMMINRNESKSSIQKGCLYVSNDSGLRIVIVIDFINYGPCCGAVEIIYAKESSLFDNALIDIIRYSNEFDYLKGEKIGIDGRLLDIGNYDWNDIVLEDGVRQEIESNVVEFFNNRGVYEKNGIPFKRGVILEGPPGTGKTLISKILVNKVNNITFILATAADIEEGSDISNLFRMARRYAPSIIFMEDIDFFAQNRSGSQSARITGELLNQLDGIEENNGIVIVATTNHQELLDEAVVHRPGRFDVMLHIGELSLYNRERLLIKFLSGRQMTDNVNLNDIAMKCEGFTGSHIKELANSVCILAISQNSLDDEGYIVLLNEHFEESIDRIKKHSLIQDIKPCCAENDICEPQPIGYKTTSYIKGFDGFIFKKENNN
jgi:cell division protease FtsH